jgi:hypothetical protein
MSGRHNGTTAVEPLRGAGLIEGCRLGVQLHVTGKDSRTKDRGVVEICLSGLDEEDLEVVVQVGQPAGYDAATTTSAAYDDVEFLWKGRHLDVLARRKSLGWFR